MACLENLKLGAPIKIFCESMNGFVIGAIDAPVVPDHVTVRFNHKGKQYRKHFKQSAAVEVDQNVFILATSEHDPECPFAALGAAITLGSINPYIAGIGAAVVGGSGAGYMLGHSRGWW